MGSPGRSVAPRVAEIERKLTELWSETATEGRPVTRACSHNLVVVCGGGDDLQPATELVARLSATAPGRALVIAEAPDESPRDGLETFVSAHCHRGAGSAQVCCEQVTLQVGRGGLELVPETVLQLLVGEIPVYTVWRRTGLTGDALLGPLRDLSDRLIVNSACMPDPFAGLGELRDLVSGPWRGQVADLTWDRLEPWREALASFFDHPAPRAHLSRVTHVAVRASGPASGSGWTAAAGYLAGWLAARLGLDPTGSSGVRFDCRRAGAGPAGEVVSARITAGGVEPAVTFVAERLDPQSPFVRLSVEAPGTCPLPHKIKLPTRDDAALLCGALQRPQRDALYEEALVSAARMGGAT